MEERQFKGIWIPSEIWLTDELTILEKIVLVEIDSLEDEMKGCFASNKYFANFFKLSPGRISQIITNLTKKNYIEVNYIKNGKEILERRIRIKRPPYPLFNKLNTYLENDDRGIKKIKEGYLENDKENNITTNNINDNKKEIYKETRFKKPTLQEVEEYCKERGNSVNAEQFIDFYESNGWRVGKNSMKDWKACVRTWERNRINEYKETRFEREQRIMKEWEERE